jgi:dynein heavy chain
MEEMPCGFSKSLSAVAFRKLLLIRSWCPDRMLQSAQNYVVQSLGPLFIDSPLLDLEAMWSESDPRVPLICILTTCSDPSQKIEQLARIKEVDIKALSMGQGQEIHARRFLQESMSNGNWLLLQNCHLNLAFCNELLESLIDGEVMQPTFRLWITTEVHPQFPISLLQTAIKFTNEPPQGIRASMKRTFTDLPQDLFDYSPSPAWPTLVYTLAFLHTVKYHLFSLSNLKNYSIHLINNIERFCSSGANTDHLVGTRSMNLISRI